MSTTFGSRRDANTRHSRAFSYPFGRTRSMVDLVTSANCRAQPARAIPVDTRIRTNVEKRGEGLTTRGDGARTRAGFSGQLSECDRVELGITIRPNVYSPGRRRRP